jgi:thymidylate synthase
MADNERSGLLRPPLFDSFDQAYPAILKEIALNHEYVNAPRGNASREVVGASFRLADPRERLPFFAVRRVNPVYNVAEALWYLAGREDLGMIGHYAPVRRAGSGKGVPKDEAAYGPRLFRPRPDGRSVFEAAFELLRTEADSKRAVLPVFQASDLDDPGAASVPCLVGLHLLLREGRLQMVVYMRANDADRGLLADVHSFTMIQEFMARLLGVELGTYTHHVGSLHVAEDDLPRVNQVLGEAADTSRPRFAPMSMPVGSGWNQIRALLEIEEQLRSNALQLTVPEIAELGLDPYWQQSVLLLEVYRQIVYCAADPIEARVLDALEPGYAWLVKHRWPGRIPAEVAR